MGQVSQWVLRCETIVISQVLAVIEDAEDLDCMSLLDMADADQDVDVQRHGRKNTSTC